MIYCPFGILNCHKGNITYLDEKTINFYDDFRFINSLIINKSLKKQLKKSKNGQNQTQQFHRYCR